MRKKVAMTTSKRKRPSDTTVGAQKEPETDPFQFLKDLDDILQQTSKSKFSHFPAVHFFSYLANAVEPDLNMYATEHLEPRNDPEHVPQQAQSSTATTTTASSSARVNENDNAMASSQIVTANDIQELKMLMGKVYTITKRSSKDLKVRSLCLIYYLASRNEEKRREEKGVESWFTWVTSICRETCLSVCFQVKNAPPVPAQQMVRFVPHSADDMRVS